ncbi:hypothetical protein ACLI09_14350 [Flavobacterium sp. RHBU_24]|uniref:hypothetical protein n=1 Tax=Flavobacterium sp. RHBU_24 TaxID=3391185 RepID=UPI0039849FE1
MKTTILHTALLAIFSFGSMMAQNVTTVRANSTDISDNLDLKAVASIFGDSRDLEDFERRLNDPKIMISNLDLNGDNRVDYLRVVELSENSTHVIVLQAVLDIDTFQDVATIEVERDSRNNVTVQVVGDTYIYGPNYIYQPVYVAPPVLFNVFWVSNYRPYYSPWYWGYYPSYYSYWAPCAPYRYHRYVNVHINTYNTYNYVNVRHSYRAATIYNSRRNNAYERQHPNTGFSSRNRSVANRYELVQSRATSGGSRGIATSTRNSNTGKSSQAVNSRSSFQNSSRNNGQGRTLSDNSVNRESSYRSGRSLTNGGTPVSTASRGNSQPSIAAPRSSSNDARSINSTPRYNNSSNVRSNTTPAQNNNAPAMRSTSPAPRSAAPRIQNSAPARQSAPSINSAPSRQQSTPRMQSPAPARQSAPAMNGGSTRGGGGNGGGRSRG